MALKVLHHSVDECDPLLLRFKLGGAILQSLEHDGIVRVRQVFEWEGHHVISMDFVSELNLEIELSKLCEEARKWNRVHRVLTCLEPLEARCVPDDDAEDAGRPSARLDGSYVRQVATWGLQVADALAAAHSQNVVHRDIKPSNILLSPEGRAVVGDFDLAYHVDGPDDLTLTRDSVGTPNYFSPEQARLERCRVPQMDVYSLGVVVYELLTLGYPFEDLDGNSDVERTARPDLEVPPPASRVRGVPARLDLIVRKALCKHASDRYADASAMAADLRRFLDGKPIEGRLPAPWTRASRFVGRHRVLAGAWGAAAVALTVMIGEVIRTRWDARAYRERTAATRFALGVRRVMEDQDPATGFLDIVHGFHRMSPGVEDNADLLEVAVQLRRRGLYAPAQRFLEMLDERDLAPFQRVTVQEELARCEMYGQRYSVAETLLSSAAEGAPVGTAERDRLETMRALAASFCGAATVPVQGIVNVFPVVLGPKRSPALLVINGAARDAETSLLLFSNEGLRERRPLRIEPPISSPLASGYSSFDEVNGKQWVYLVLEGAQLAAFSLNAESTCLEERWTEPMSGNIDLVVRGDLDGDGIAELVVAHGKNARELVVLRETPSGRLRLDVPYKESGAAEDTGTVAIVDLNGDGRSELLVGTRGHRDFSVSRFSIDGDAMVRVGEPLRAGAVRSSSVVDRDNSGAEAIIGRSFTPGRRDLAGRLDPRFDPGAGLYRVSIDEGEWDVARLWTVDPLLGWWASPSHIAIGTAGPHAGMYALGRLERKTEIPDVGHVRDIVWIVCPLEPRGADGWTIRSLSRGLLSDIDGDGRSEPVFFDEHRVVVKGLEAAPERHVSSAERDLPAHEVGEGALLELAYALDRAPDRAEEAARRAASVLASTGRTRRALDVLLEWYGDAPRRTAPVERLLGDLSLLSGDHARAEEYFRGAVEKGGGRLPAGIIDSSVDVLEVARHLREHWPVRFHESFEESQDRWLMAVDEQGVTAGLDPFGRRGGRYEDPRYVTIRVDGEWARNVRPGDSLRRGMISRRPVWDGRSSFRLSFLVYFEALGYASSFQVELVRPGAAGSAPVCAFNFGHARNSQEQEGDRYRVTVDRLGSGPITYRTGHLVSEFPLGQWLEVEFEYVRELGVGHVELHHVNRGRTRTPLARIDLGCPTPPRSGPVLLRFDGVVQMERGEESGTLLSVLLDDVTVSH